MLIIFSAFDHPGVGVAVLLLSGLASAILRRRQYYLVTTGVVVRRVGIFANNTDEFPIRYVSGVSVRQGIMDRLLGIGNIEFVSMADSANRIVFEGVHDPHGVQDAIRPFVKGG